MVEWRKSMKQTFEYYEVDPVTWKDAKIIDTITSCNIERDSTVSTLGSATIDSTTQLSECYIRIYIIAIQNGVKYKEPLGTYIVQTPSSNFNGKYNAISMDAYTPLLELKSNNPPLGYSVLKDTNIMDVASTLCRENMRAPVVAAKNDTKMYSDFVSNLDDNWLIFISDLIANAKYTFDLDPMGRVLFAPKQDIASLQSVWTYDDSDCSILYPDIQNSRDLYGIPNVVEVVYSTGAGYLRSRIVNDDPNSPISTVNRGREVLHRDSNPNFTKEPTQEELDEYATQLLRNLSCLEHTIKYKHGYCPVRVGDCVTLNVKSAGLVNIRAKVISQSIECKTGCPVSETAVYTTKLWR